MPTNIDDHLDRMGLKVQKRILQKIDNRISPGNAPSTIEKKGFDHPLVDSGNLYSSITYTVNDGTLDVGVLETASAETKTSALVNEFGTNDGHTPQRSFLRSTWDESEDQLLDEFSNDILNALERELDKI